MKILFTFPGNLSTVPMNRYVLESLQEMGHQVFPFNYGIYGVYRRVLKRVSEELLQRRTDQELTGLVEKFRPNMLLTLYGFAHGIETLEEIRRKGVLTACWWLNDPFQFNRSAPKAGHYDFYFTNSKGILAEYRARGINNVHYLPVGIFPPVHRRLPDQRKEYEMSFAGDWCPIREKILESLAKDFNFVIFGPWKNKLRQGSVLAGRLKGGKFFAPEEMVRIFNRSKVVLNIHSWFDKSSYGINPRVFEACGSGSFQLCDFKEEIPLHYVEDREIVLYRSVEELKEKLAFYLRDDAGRSEIADRALSRSHRTHTYVQRLDEMLRICGA